MPTKRDCDGLRRQPSKPDDATEHKRFVVDFNNLPFLFPTHRHDPMFWETLGRTVATFGFLEEMLGKAIFAFTATTRHQESEIDAAFENWLPTLERALVDPLGSLIDAYGKAVRNNSDATIENLDETSSGFGNPKRLCHGSWRTPDAGGNSLPLFVNKQKMVWDTPIDILYLKQTQKAVAELGCAVINTVTHMGWQFLPGSHGPGKTIFEKPA